MPALQKEFELHQPDAGAAPEKIVVNIGLGEALQNAKALDAAVGDLAIITGQKPVVTRPSARSPSSGVRTGNAIGVRVTLRGEHMWDFLERLTRIALPRIRDFRGVPGRSFDGRGNYSLGLREQLAFPEIDYDKIDRLRGLEVSIVTTATNPTRSQSVCWRSSACPSPAGARSGSMAKKSLIAKSKRKPRFASRGYHRCLICGRPRGYMRRFAMCRICFRERALLGELPGRDQVELVAP